MTAVESLPAYAQAEAAARRNGLHVSDLVNAYLAGYAAGSVANPSHKLAVDVDGYPVFRIDESKVDIVTPKTDPVTGKHVWPEKFIDD